MSLINIPRGPEFRVNTVVANNQSNAVITELGKGGWAVAFTSFDQDGDRHGIYVQSFNAAGNAIGGQRLVNTYTTNEQTFPAIASLSGGGFVVSWTSFGQDKAGQGIFAQRFSSKGVAVGAETEVNTTRLGDQEFSSVTGLDGGGYLVAWQSSGIYGQRFGSNGAADGPEFQIDSGTSGTDREPSVTTLTNGDFVVTWTSDNQDGSSNGVFGRVYSGAGVARGAEFQINTYSTSSQDTPSVTKLAGGGFVVTWTSAGQDGSGLGIYGQIFDASASAVGAEFRVNPAASFSQFAPSVAGLADGGFVATWITSDQDGSSFGIFGQRFDATGAAIGDEIAVNTTTAGPQLSPTVTGTANGGFVVSWQSSDADQGGIFAQAFQPQLIGTSGDDVLRDSISANWISGQAGNDVLKGLGGNDRLFGDAGHDLLFGGAGNDRLFGNAGNDQLFGDVGNDRLTGGNGQDILKGNGGDDILKGGKGSDTLVGHGGRDVLEGGAGNDYLLGRTGRDTLNGGAGSDTLIGGAGADRFVFAANGGADRITDFTDNVDTLALDGALWGGGLNRAEVIATYASVVSGDTVFDFGGGDVLTLTGVSNENTLLNDLVII